MTSPARALGVVLAGALSLATLAGCSGGTSETSGDSSGGTATSGAASDPAEPGGTTPAPGEPAPYLPVPDGVVLTDPGSELGVGESATVAFRPRRHRVGVLKLTVRKLQRADIKALEEWQLDQAGRASALYYVTVSVKNRGATDLGGRRIPLYVMDARNTLVESNAFRSTFKPCASPALPKTFGPGTSTTVCLVYLVPRHGTLVNATFRPTEGFNPITWVGQVTAVKPPKKKRSR
jgi:hypothetical protein